MGKKQIINEAIVFAIDAGYDVAHDGKANYFNFSDGFAIGYFEVKDHDIFSLLVEVKSGKFGTHESFIQNAKYDIFQIAQQLENTLTFNPITEEDESIIYWQNFREFTDDHWNPEWRVL